jgi:hypothetical protein
LANNYFFFFGFTGLELLCDTADFFFAGFSCFNSAEWDRFLSLVEVLFLRFFPLALFLVELFAPMFEESREM